MASSSQLNQWIFEHAKRLDLQVDRLEWVRDWCPGLTDFFVTIRVDGKIYEGRGTADSEDLAFAKAGGEALERVAAASVNAASTNGFAAHPNAKNGAALARAELIERDAYFCHWLTKTPFLSLEPNQYGTFTIGNSSVLNIISRLKSMGIDLRHAQMMTIDGSLAVVCIARGTKAARSFGIVQGFGGATKLEDAISKATLECLRTVVAWDRGTYMGGGPLSRKSFAEIISPGPLEHERFGLGIDTAGILDSYLLSADVASASALTDFPIKCEEIPLPNAIKSAPVAVMRATSPYLQNAVFGHLKPANINFQRLDEFCKRTIGVNDICFDTHCFG